MTALHRRTPLVQSDDASAAAGVPVWLKLESLQPSGSFKLRGLGHAAAKAAAAGARALCTSSGGNAGLAVAWAGRALGLPTTVVVPTRTSADARARIAALGATVVVHGEVWDDAHAEGLRRATDPGTAYLHPFDDPDVWAGHASLVAEAAEALAERPGVVVLSVGGGGLLAGVVAGMHEAGWGDVPVVAVETEGAASFAAALAAGRPVDIGRITSIATTLGARRVADRAVACASERTIASHLVTDDAAVRACLRFLDAERILVEPSCGAALAAVYDRAPALAGAASILVVVCGGACVTLDALLGWAGRRSEA